MIETQHLKKMRTFAFNGHQLIMGMSGSGKSVAAERRMAYYAKRGKHVVIDLGDKGRFENFCYSLPETDVGLLRELHRLTHGSERPETIPNESILLCGRGLYNNRRLPKNIRLCSFSKEDMKITYMHSLLGETRSLLDSLNNLQAKYGDDFNLADLESLIFRGEFRGKRQNFRWPGNAESTKNMMINRLRTWLGSGLFSDHESVEKFDFDKYFTQKGKIISINNYLLYPEEDAIAYSIILDKLFEMKRNRLIKPPIALCLRELSNFTQWKTTKDVIRVIMTQGRGYGIEVTADFQYPSQIPPEWRGQAGYNLQMKATTRAAEMLAEVQPVPKFFLQKVPFFRPGEGILTTGQHWYKNIQMPPNTHRHANPKKFQVLQALGREFGWRSYDADAVLAFDRHLDLEEEEPVAEQQTRSEAAQVVLTPSTYVPRRKEK